MNIKQQPLERNNNDNNNNIRSPVTQTGHLPHYKHPIQTKTATVAINQLTMTTNDEPTIQLPPSLHKSSFSHVRPSVQPSARRSTPAKANYFRLLCPALPALPASAWHWPLCRRRFGFFPSPLLSLVTATAFRWARSLSVN